MKDYFKGEVDPVRSRTMSRIRSKNTGPEVALRKALHGRGVRFRIHDRSVPGTPDVAIRGARLAVFIDGCFWHGCPRHYRPPKSRKRFWNAKLAYNLELRSRVRLRLAYAGWACLECWECDVRKNPTMLASQVEAYAWGRKRLPSSKKGRSPTKGVPLLPKGWGHKFPSMDALLRHAWTLEGHTAGELAASLGDHRFNQSPKPIGKKGVGTLVENYFGKRSDNLREPDFQEFGTELKTLPMKQVGRVAKAWTVKEPTSITMIDYDAVDKETWRNAYVQRKIARILWVPYEHHPTDKRKSRFRRAFLWSPPATDHPVFEQDYGAVREYVHQGRAHELSETLSTALAARRKGSKGSTTSQPHSPKRAKTRAWAFKPSYTRPILSTHVLGRRVVSIVEEVPAVKNLARVEEFVENRLSQLAGKTLRQIRTEKGLHLGSGKNAAATFMRQVLGLPARGEIAEFDKLGIRIHTVWVRTGDLYPWEAVSFPAMKLQEFANEEWEESDFLDQVDRILFLPLYSDSRNGGKQDRVLGKPFFWSPTPLELSRIRNEWGMYRSDVKAGKAAYRALRSSSGAPLRDSRGRLRRENQLKSMEETEFIHMRPHAKDSTDMDTDPIGNRLTKQCLWLNKRYLQMILKESRSADGTI